jgi:hypothetical protein
MDQSGYEGPQRLGASICKVLGIEVVRHQATGTLPEVDAIYKISAGPTEIEERNRTCEQHQRRVGPISYWWWPSRSGAPYTVHDAATIEHDATTVKHDSAAVEHDQTSPRSFVNITCRTSARRQSMAPRVANLTAHRHRHLTHIESAV